MISASQTASMGIVFAVTLASAAAATTRTTGIWCDRESERAVAPAHEERLVQSLRRITGFHDLRFSEDGSLELGEPAALRGGAAPARDALLAARRPDMAFIIEDHSASDSVIFAQLDQGTAVVEQGSPLERSLVWRVRLDFADFDRVEASRGVRAAFDPGFALLHELLHGLGLRDATFDADGSGIDEVGPVENVLNQARAELGLPLRDRYLAEGIPIAAGVVSVRLRFCSVQGGRHEYLRLLVYAGPMASEAASLAQVTVGGKRRMRVR